MQKKLTLLAACCLLPGLAWSADKLETQKQRFSYALGYQMGMQITQGKAGELDADALTAAIRDVMKSKEPQLSLEDMKAAFEEQQKILVAEEKAKADNAKAAGEAFLAENAKKKGVTQLQNGIQYEVLKSGKGESPKETDTVTVHYHGTLIDGTVFDSSVERGQPTSFAVNGVIPGFREALTLMKPGDKWRVVIPSDLAYGPRGAGDAIGPHSTLIFELELLEVAAAPAS